MTESDIKRLAEGVMGWTGEMEETYWPCREWTWRDKEGYRVATDWRPDKNIADAIMIVKALRHKGVYIGIDSEPDGYSIWELEIEDDEGEVGGGSMVIEPQSTPEQAITMFALAWLDRGEV